MTYAHVTDGTIDRFAESPPTVGAKPDGATVSGIQPDDLVTLAACGWHPVADTARPVDTATHTHDRSVAMVAGTPTVVWTQRALTADELAFRAAQANRSTIHTQAGAALATNTAYIGVASPTNAQNAAQIKALTRQVNKLIRLAINKLDGTD